MERFTQGTILIIFLTVLGCLDSKNPYIVFGISGILLCVICKESLEEDRNKLMMFIRYLLSLIFVIITDKCILYMIFYLNGNYYESLKTRKKYNLVLPSITYLLVQIILNEKTLPMILVHMFILGILSVGIYFIQFFVEKYVAANNTISQAVSIMAVNEMYTKKLNQELIIKNYLADKNARLEERENISRNIHNSVGHSITAAVMTLDAADMLFFVEPEKAREKMNTANKRIRESLDSIRQAVRVLDNENKYISINDFISELTAVTDNFVMDTMIKIYTNFENIGIGVVIPHEHTEFLTGALQELLSNGVRHGNADEFIITLIADSSNIKLKVSDNGKSDFSKENQKERIENGFGIKKMISYVKKCGGYMTLSNENGFVTEITIKLFEDEIS